MKIRLHLNIFIFIIVFILTKQIQIYGVILLFSILHELGHILTGILFRFKLQSMEIMPFGFSIEFASKVENYNKKIKKGTMLNLKKIIIAISGPMVNFLFAFLFFVYPISLFNIDREVIIYANIMIGVFNLIPIYPLDGGRILKNVISILYGRKVALESINIITQITISVVTAICSIVVLYYKNWVIILILAYLWMLVLQENKKYKKKRQLYDKIEEILK